MVELTGTLHRHGCAIRFADSAGVDPAGIAADGATLPPIVFVHGAGADHHMFDNQSAALVADGHRVVVWDQRSHGQSRPSSETFTAEVALADLTTLVDHLALKRPILVGLSLGGNLAQAAVRADPDRWAALAVLDATWNTGPLSRMERSLLTLAAPALRLIPQRSLPTMMARASAVTDAAIADAIRAFEQQTRAEFIAAWRTTVAFVKPDDGYRTAIPLCLVRGELDATGNIATSMPRWARAEGIREHVVPGAGHLVTQDAPEETTRILRGFIASLEGEQTR